MDLTITTALTFLLTKAESIGEFLLCDPKISSVGIQKDTGSEKCVGFGFKILKNKLTLMTNIFA